MTELLLPRHIEWASKKFDDALDFKELIANKIVGAVLEGVDGGAASLTLRLLNAKVSQYDVLDPYKEDLHIALDDVIDGDDDYTDAVNAALDILDEIVDSFVVNDTLDAVLSTLIDLLRIGLHSLLEK